MLKKVRHRKFDQFVNFVVTKRALDLDAAKRLTLSALKAIENGQLGYAIVSGVGFGHAP
jgi:hypothetical protein